MTLGSVWALGAVYAVVTDQVIGREPDLPCQVRHGHTLPGTRDYLQGTGYSTWTYTARYMGLPTGYRVQYMDLRSTLPVTWDYPAIGTKRPTLPSTTWTYPVRYDMDVPCQVDEPTLLYQVHEPACQEYEPTLPGTWTYPTSYMDLHYQVPGPTLPGTWVYPTRYSTWAYPARHNMDLPYPSTWAYSTRYMGITYQVRGHTLLGTTWTYPTRYMGLPY